MIRLKLLTPLVAVSLAMLSFTVDRPLYLDPVACVADAARQRIYVALAGQMRIVTVDARSERPVASWALPMAPTGLTLSADGSRLVATMGQTNGRVAVVDTQTGQIERTFEAGFSPVSPVLSGDALAVCNRYVDRVSFYSIADGRKLGETAVSREPYAAAATPDGSRLFVGCHLPAQPATAAQVASVVDVIDFGKRERVGRIDLPNGSTAVSGLAVSPDGRTAFVTHLIGHYQVPTNQLERGWMNANALSILDTGRAERRATVLLDDVTDGAANPWGLAVTDNGQTLVVAHHGTSELSCIPLPALMRVVDEGGLGGPGAGSRSADLEYELRTMQTIGRRRVPLDGRGPRAVAILGARAYVAEYFSGTLGVVDVTAAAPRSREVALGAEPLMDQVRRGEWRFHDATLCFQRWQSCASCHPGARTDGLNWDLLNDGVGNPKQTRSMLLAHQTPPVMALGVRDRAETAVRAGIRFIQFAEVREEDAAAIDAYLKSLQPLASPHLVDGQLSELARQGEAVFEQASCSRCHSPPHGSDGESYPMPYATGSDRDRPFDTPVLTEVWRTAPYLYDGRAADMATALREHSEHARDLSEAQMRALVEYVLSQ